MKIRANERVLFAGKTGSGKTFAAGSLLAPVSRLVVIDPKANLASWNLKVPNFSDWRRLERGKPGRFRIMPPITVDPEAWYEDLFKRLYYIGNLMVYIDEAYAVVPPGARPGQWLSALYTRGRELGIGLWSATQRPAWIPLFMLSESDWFLIFRLNLDVDRRRLAGVIGDQVMLPIPDKHGFYLYHVEDDRAVYHRQVSVG